jgi:sec-independent protein translocase protein TatC
MVKRVQPGAEMPFLDHLEELRHRLFWIIGSVLVGFMGGVGAHRKFDLVTLLKQPACPYLPDGCTLQVLSPMDPITIPFTLAFWAGVIVASPVILYQLWRFVSPALYANERRISVYVVSGGVVLFLAGAALSYFFVLPATFSFANAFGGPSLAMNFAAREYFSMVAMLILTFGLAFELPIVILALTALGLVTPTFLRQYRRHAVVLCFVGSALITPGDAFTATFMLVPPLYALYELGILLSGGAYRWRERRDRGDDTIGLASEAKGSA